MKKSRFVAVAVPVESEEEARRRIVETSDDAATHNCWAYKIDTTYRFSDDGEPGGTAGRPILAAIEKCGIDRCLVVVTRFFGGIKLGAGGLARAYGGSAAECLRTAKTERLVLREALSILLPFDAIGEVYPLLKKFHADKRQERYEEDGVRIDVMIDTEDIGRFKESLANATRGRAELFEEGVP